MRASGKPVSAGWLSQPYTPSQRRSTILIIGACTQIIIIFTFFDSAFNTASSSASSSTLFNPNNPYNDSDFRHQLELLRIQKQNEMMMSMLKSSAPSALLSSFNDYNISHVNFPIRFERQLIPSSRSYRPRPFAQLSNDGTAPADSGDPSRLVAPPTRRIRGLKCIQIAGDRGLQSIEGIGAVFRLNQLAVFIASYFEVDIAFPSKPSEHGYDISSSFSDCGYSSTYMDMPKECVLNQERMVIEECPPGDCQCLGNQIRPYLTDILSEQGRRCSVIGVLSDRYKTQQFSGCYRPLLNRYFGTQPVNEEPSWKFDAIHYRHGDLAEKPGGKSFAPYQLEHLMRTLCDMSDRDIVVLTEGAPPVPRCNGEQNRIIIANSSIQHAFAIMQHAQHVAVGLGGFSIILAEMAVPKRMIMLDLHVRFFRWLSCQYWTVVTGSGARFHFATKAHMLMYALSTANLHRERFLNPGDIRLKRLEWKVPSRVFDSTLLKPVNPRPPVDSVLRDGEKEG